ncbi:acyl-CoA thioester hydrolase [Cellulomonas marina]|uniref:Acyl-CoA thioester hydrolase n=1 Tax=Cellulomonas marina TaxID=988821 RepID=A0A1I0V8G1_9CELL|nr:acyl-CoA thioester hydrolase [Cellulomonas marina]
MPVHLRWSDMDAYAHVNNVAMMVLLEEARIAAFWSAPPGGPAAGGTGRAGGGPHATAVLEAGPDAAVATFVARHEIEYLVPLPYLRDPVVVALWLGRMGGASLDICYEVRDRPAADPASVVHARAESTLVLMDTATGRPRRIGPAERAVWEPYVEEPVALRRRTRA